LGGVTLSGENALLFTEGKQAVHKMLLQIPMRMETRRIVPRSYRSGDVPWYYAMSQKNRAHLTR